MTVSLFMQILILSTIIILGRILIKDVNEVLRKRTDTEIRDDFGESHVRIAALDFLEKELNWTKSMMNTVEGSRNTMPKETLEHILEGLHRQTELLTNRMEELQRQANHR